MKGVHRARRPMLHDHLENVMNSHHPLLAAAYGCIVCVVVAALGFYPFRRRAGLLALDPLDAAVAGTVSFDILSPRGTLR